METIELPPYRRFFTPLRRAPIIALWVLAMALVGHEFFTGRPLIGLRYAEDPDRVPRIVGITASDAETPLRVGDRVLEIDGQALQGKLRFPGTIERWARPRTGTSVAVVVERNGERIALEHPLRRGGPWQSIVFPIGLVWGVCGLLIWRRAGDQLLGDFGGAALVTGGFMFAFPIGSPLSAGVTLATMGVGAGSLVLANVSQYGGAPWLLPRSALFKAFLALVGLRAITLPGSIFGLPGVPPSAQPWLFRIDLLIGAIGLVGFVVASRRVFAASPPDARRRARFVELAVAVGFAPLPIVALFAALGWPLVDDYAQGFLLTVLLPISLVLADFEHLDLDRVVTSSALLTVLAAAGLATALLVLPTAVNALAAQTGIGTTPSVLAVTLAIVGLGYPIVRSATPRLEGWLYPERAALRDQADRLVRDLPAADDAIELAKLLGERLAGMLRPRSLSIVLREEALLVPVVARGAGTAPPIEADGVLAAELAVSPGAWSLQREDPLERDGLVAAERRFLAELDPAVLVPVRRRGRLAMVWSFGAKRSGDVYTPGDLSLLATLAEAASAQLERLDERDLLSEARAQVEALDAAGAEKTRFLATASHDLRQPLSALSLLVASLDDRAGDAETSALAAKIRAATVDLREMVEGVMDLSKLEAGAEAPEPSRFPLGLLLERLASELAPEAHAAGLGFVVPETSLQVTSDAILLRRILQNLLTNAIKYTREGEVRLALREEEAGTDGPSVWIDVVDTGPGLSEAEQVQVFEAWQRAARDVDGPAEGLGLGLSIVQQLAGWLGHPLDVASTPGEGSRFSVRVPVADAEARPSTRKDVLDGLDVVWLGNGASLEACSSALETWGCRVHPAATADEARTAIVASEGAVLVAEQRAAGPELEAWLASPDAPTAAIVGSEGTPGAVGTALGVKGPLSPPRLRAVLTHLARAALPPG